MSNTEFSHASWVWSSQTSDQPNQYVQFRQEFDLQKKIDRAEIHISCDSNYALWVNGDFIYSGGYHDYPDSKTYDVVSISNLRQEANVVAVLAYYQGETSFQYIKGSPGLIYEILAGEVIVSSGKDTICRRDRNYKQGPAAKITGQLGYTFEYNAQGADDWRGLEYQPSDAWTDGFLTTVVSSPLAGVRPVSKLVYGERLKPRVATQGVFIRDGADKSTVAESMETDYLSTRTAPEVFEGSAIFDGGEIVIRQSAAQDSDGTYLILDLGREEAGLLALDIEAPATTVVDIAWGEHLDDLRVRAFVGERNFACRYICKEGRQSFTHYFTRLAGRFLELHIGKASGDVVLHYAGLIPATYPVERRGSFECSDTLYNKIYQTSVRTLHLCMHEHYEDCPWREQALYAMDMRNQALAGYYCFGEYDFPAASLDLLGRGLKPDGFLELCAPAEIAITIPVFTFAWVLAVADHYLYSGDIDLAKRLYPAVKSVVDARVETMGNGLLASPPTARYWHFYDWVDGLDGCADNDCAAFGVLNDLRHDAPLNMFFILALEAAANLAEAVGDDSSKAAHKMLAESLRPRVHDMFWDANDGSYVTYMGAGAKLHRGELIQALAILSGVSSESIANSLRARLAARGNGLVRSSISLSLYKFEALLTDMNSYGAYVLDSIAEDWGYMLLNGATSFWETIKGSADFDNAGSLCHGWSGIPAYFYQAYILGIKPTSPGFKTFKCDPIAGGPERASGTVPTPYGPITVSLKPGDGVVSEVTSPKEIFRDLG